MQEYIPFFQSEKRSIAEKLAKYFEYSGLETKIHFDEKEDAYILSVPSQKEKEAKKFYQAFYFVERDRIEKEEKDQDSLDEFDESNILSISSGEDASVSSLYLSNQEIASTSMDDLDPDTVYDPEEATEEVADQGSDGYANQGSDEGDNKSTSDDSSEVIQNDLEKDEKAQMKSLLSSSGSYVMKSEKYKDYKGTEYVFLLLGIAGLIFVFLNIIEVLTLLYGLFPNLIMGALFVFFIYVGLSTGKKARLLKEEIEAENELTAKIIEWLHTTVTDEFLASITNSDLSEELDYIKKTETIRDMLNKEFGEQNRDYLDRLIEEFYSETFDASNEYIEGEVK
jgi:hypothetical protein